MCGRFNVIDNPGLQQLLRDLGIDLQLPDRSNIAPTETVGLVRSGGADGNEMVLARWWLTPSWSKGPDQKYAMFNARSETLSSSRAWRTPFSRQRGILPMSSFIEWRSEEGARQPYLVSIPGDAIAGAALWDTWRDPEGDGVLVSCSLVTTASAPEFSPWHKRMPVMLQRADFDRWLDNSAPIAANDPLFAPKLSLPLEVAALDRGVNNARNTDPALLEPVAEPVTLQPGAD